MWSQFLLDLLQCGDIDFNSNLDFASMRLAKYIWPLFGTFLPNTDATWGLKSPNLGWVEMAKLERSWSYKMPWARIDPLTFALLAYRLSTLSHCHSLMIKCIFEVYFWRGLLLLSSDWWTGSFYHQGWVMNQELDLMTWVMYLESRVGLDDLSHVFGSPHRCKIQIKLQERIKLQIHPVKILVTSICYSASFSR